MRSTFLSLSLVLVLLGSLSSVFGHMEMKYPPPRLSQYSDLFDYTEIDYDINAPLNVKGNQLCQGKPAGPVTATLTAGQKFTSQIVGYAPHKGGHCQWSLSYDQGKTFVVIDTYMENCPLTPNWEVTIPATAPASNKAILAWSWVNAEGNREYYMNCADVAIKQNNPAYATAGSVTGPKLLIVNQPGYPTIPEFLGNPKTGKELFDARPTITVKLSGSSTAPPTTPPTTPTQPTQPTEPAPPTTPTTPTTPSTPSNPPPPSTNCRCQWAAFCGADSCGKTGAESACQCASGAVCQGGPSFQCRAPGAGGAPSPVEPTPPTAPTPPSNPAPTPGANCRCLWAAYCGADTCGVQGAGSACQCATGTKCQGGPYFQCRA